MSLTAEYKIESYGSLCHLEVFTINGKKAYEEDFVEKYDHSPEDVDEYGCGDMRCDIISPTQEVLKKYGITKEDYFAIADDICSELNFGECGQCV